MTRKPNFAKFILGVTVLALLFIGTWAATRAPLTSAKNRALRTATVSNNTKGALTNFGPLPTPTPTPDFPSSAFELDGDIVDNPNGAPDDWVVVNCDGGGALAKTGVLHDGLAKSIFTGGGSKDPDLLSSWKHKDGSVPDKDEIINAYAAKYLGSPNGDEILLFGADRYDNSGSAFIGFWFFKGTVVAAADGKFRQGPLATDALAAHEVGDVLVLIEFSVGGTFATSKVFEWVGSGGDQSGGTLQDITGTAPAGSVFSISNGSGVQIPNSGSCPGSWEYTPKGGIANGPIPSNAFFEGGINLDAFPALAGSCFSSFAAETRSSASTTATLKDFVLGQFNTCVSLEVSKEADNEEVCDGALTTYTYVPHNMSGLAVSVTVIDDNETPGDTSDDLDVANQCAPIGLGSATLVPLAADDGVAGSGPDEQTFTCSRTLSVGTHTNVVTVAGSVGGSSDSVTATETVTVHPNPTAEAGPAQAACELTASHQFQMAATATTVTGGDLTWSVVTSPAGSTVGFSNNKAEDPLVTVNRFGVYTLMLTASNPETGANCNPASDTVVLTLFQSPVADAGDDASACENTASKVFQIAGTGGTVVPANGSILWTVESGSATIAAGEEDDLSPHVTLSAFGSAVLKMTVTNPQTGITAGCGNAEDTVTLTLNQNPVVEIDDVACNAADGGVSIDLVAEITAGGGTTNGFKWRKVGSVTIIGTNATLNVTTPGTYTVEVTAIHADGSVSCTSFKSKNVGLCASDAAPAP